MEFSSVWYNSFWSIISQITLTIALVASDEASLLNFIPDDYKGLIYFPSYLSSIYAFFVRPLMEPDLTNGRIINYLAHFLNNLLLVLLLPVYPMWFLRYHRLTIFIQVCFPLLILVLLPPVVYSILILYRKCKEMGMFLTGFAGPFLMYPCHTLCCALLTASLFSVACISSCSDPCKPIEIVLNIAHLFGSCVIFAFFLVTFCLRHYVSRLRLYEVVNMKMIEILLGWMGYILAQYCIQKKSVSLLVMLSSLAISWLGNLAVIQPRTDFWGFPLLHWCDLGLCNKSLRAWKIHLGCSWWLCLPRTLAAQVEIGVFEVSSCTDECYVQLAKSGREDMENLYSFIQISES